MFAGFLLKKNVGQKLGKEMSAKLSRDCVAQLIFGVAKLKTDKKDCLIFQGSRSSGMWRSIPR